MATKITRYRCGSRLGQSCLFPVAVLCLSCCSSLEHRNKQEVHSQDKSSTEIEREEQKSAIAQCADFYGIRGKKFDMLATMEVYAAQDGEYYSAFLMRERVTVPFSIDIHRASFTRLVDLLRSDEYAGFDVVAGDAEITQYVGQKYRDLTVNELLRFRIELNKK